LLYVVCRTISGHILLLEPFALISTVKVAISLSVRELSPLALTPSQVRPMGAARARHDRWGPRISANEMEVSEFARNRSSL
jgi:hypothetical protein